MLSVGLRGNARVLISFVPPKSSKSLILRVKHSGEEDGPLAVTLGSNKIQLNPSTQSPVTIDDITLYPIDVSGSSESDHLSFEPEVRNDIFIRFIGPDEYHYHHHILHDIELLDEAGLEYMPHSASLSKPSSMNSLWEIKEVFKDVGVCFFFSFSSNRLIFFVNGFSVPDEG